MHGKRWRSHVITLHLEVTEHDDTRYFRIGIQVLSMKIMLRMCLTMDPDNRHHRDVPIRPARQQC
jgi:hypothetical protein